MMWQENLTHQYSLCRDTGFGEEKVTLKLLIFSSETRELLKAEITLCVVNNYTVQKSWPEIFTMCCKSQV